MENINLSDREVEILKLLGQGKSNKDIAQELFISINTVKVHVNNIFKKLGVSSRTEATLYAIEHELIQNPRQDSEPTQVSVPVGTAAEATTQNATLFARFWWLFLLGGLAVLVGLTLVLSKELRDQGPKPTIDPLLTTLNQERWRVLTPIPTAREGMAISVWDDAIYAIGGKNADGPTKVVERFVRSTNKWERLTDKPTATVDANAATVGGKIYIPGGELSDGTILNVMEVYDPRTDRWSVKKDLPIGISRFGIATFEGKIYLFGGWDGQKYLNSTWVYNPNLDRWSELSPMPMARADINAVGIEDELFIFGGNCEHGPCKKNLAFYPNLEDSQEQPWKEQLSFEEGNIFIGAQEVSGSLFLISKTEDGKVELQNYTPQSNSWYTFTEEPTVELLPGAQLTSLGGHIFFLGGKAPDGTPSDQFLRYQAVFTIVLPSLGK